jgi:hypothetical protein
MRLPRIILNPAVGVWIRLWQSQRKETARLRRELSEMRAERDEWRDKLLQKVNVTPLFTPPPKPVEPHEMPPIGPRAKKLALATQRGPNNNPTAEEIAASRN